MVNKDGLLLAAEGFSFIKDTNDHKVLEILLGFMGKNQLVYFEVQKLLG
jgi:hypothetical protein